MEARAFRPSVLLWNFRPNLIELQAPGVGMQVGIAEHFVLVVGANVPDFDEKPA